MMALVNWSKDNGKGGPKRRKGMMEPSPWERKKNKKREPEPPKFPPPQQLIVPKNTGKLTVPKKRPRPKLKPVMKSCDEELR